MSQLPAISEVGNVHPDDTTGEKPPNTDSDADGIPDVHESLFEDWINWSSVDGRDVIMAGLDKQYAPDALLDIDNDGLTALEEYCWPHPGNCTEPGFPRGLTGKLDAESGERTYLDPRKSDTDGDGMPDELWGESTTGLIEDLDDDNDGIYDIVEGGDIIQPLTERILGRVIAEQISNTDGEEVYPIGHLIDEDSVKKIDELNISSLKEMSSLSSSKATPKTITEFLIIASVI